MVTFLSGFRTLVCLLLVTYVTGQQQNIPDAPKPKPQASQPNQFPDDAPPAPKNSRADGPDAPAASAPPPAPAVAQQAPPGVVTTRNDLYKFTVAVNFVQVPVTVMDNSGHLVPGLGPNDFTVYEDGEPQQLKFFTSDPFPLSTAIVLDTDLPSTTMKKVNETLPALIGAFSEF